MSPYKLAIARIAGLSLFLLTLPAQADKAVSRMNPTIYDGYHMGIHTYILEVKARGEVATYSLRKKDLAKNQWGEPVEATAAGLQGNDNFQLAYAIADFPASLASLSSIDWVSNTAVGWPDENTIYVRRNELKGQVDGNSLTTTYWAAKDASSPMDLVIGPDNEVIAAIDVRFDQLMVQRGYEDFTTVKQWRDPFMSQPGYGYRALDMQMVPTRSGAKLATRIYLPEGDVEGPFPTIFIRTPYGITKLIERYQHYANRGFAVVLQAVKGTAYWDPESHSEGDWNTMAQESADGADALQWITRQPWSNGSVCMQGASYYGYTQWALTMANNPALKCLVPEVSMGTAFSDQPYMGGTFVQGLAFYIFWMTDNPLLQGRNWVDVMRYRPLVDMDEYATGKDIPQWNNFFKHWRNDGFWKAQDWYAGEHDRNVATLQISGWFDDDYPGTRSNWALMTRYGTQANRLLLGPWKHGYNADRKLNGYSFGVNALRDDIWLIKQRWYDYHLKGIQNGVTDTRVEYFILGENQWRSAEAWPPNNAQSQSLYFHSTGKANRHPGDGRLNLVAPEEKEEPESYTYDPRDPVQNWYSFDLMKSWADVQSFPYDFKDIEARHDLASYTTTVLEEDLTIAGNIKVVLYASTDVRDTDWWAYISDVAPDNSSNRLSVGVLRARFRKLEDTDYHVFGSNFETEELLSGNIAEVVRYEISIPSIANTFKKGHRIRVAIMNAHDGYSFPNSNTGGAEGFVTQGVVGKMKIHHSPEHPSQLILPVLPAATD